LLRTVQERKVKRIGSTKEIDLDVRIIVATNENLVENIAKGTFREDLYHRFNEFSIHISSLKKRGKDILVFANKFLAIANEELSKDIKGFSEGVKNCFLNYSWPGNVRELKNVVRRVALLSDGNEFRLMFCLWSLLTMPKISTEIRYWIKLKLSFQISQKI